MAGARLRPGSRLRTRAAFDRVFERPIRAGNRWFTVLARASEHPDSRLGLVVSKRVDKRATVRNRLKRLIRESFRNHQHRLAPLDIVVIPRPSAARQTGSDLLSALERIWQQLPPAATNE